MLRPLNFVNRLAPLVLGLALAVAAHAQPSAAAPQAPAAKAPAKAPSKAAPAQAAKAPAKTQSKAPAKSQAKPPAHKPAPRKPAVTHHKPKVEPEKHAEKKEEEVAAPEKHGRDPFLALYSVGHGPLVLPPGKAGLQVSTLRVDGIVRSQNGMIVVVLNPQGRTYFLHQGDRVFDGRVEQISMDAVTFQESGKDPFGHEIERTVVKRVYPSAGEQQ